MPTGTCSTAGATAAKEVSVSGYTETAGARFYVTFENKNTALGPALYIPFTGGTAADPLGVYTLTTIGSPTYTGDKFNSNGNSGLSYNITSLGEGTWCIQGKFKSTNTSTRQTLFHTANNYGITLIKQTDNKLRAYVSSNNSSWNVAITGTKADWGTSTDYYIRMRYDGAHYYVDWSADGDSWTNDISITSSTNVYSAIDGIIFGLNYSAIYPLIGTMDDLYVSIGSDTIITDYPTLNINSGGAKSILHADGTRVTPATPAYFIANCPIEFCYDGTGYRFKQEIVKTYRNGTTWYKLRNDGWVEQGGYYSLSGNWGNGNSPVANIVLPIPMNNTSYSITMARGSSSGLILTSICSSITTTGFSISNYCTGASTAVSGWWRVEGFAA